MLEWIAARRTTSIYFRFVLHPTINPLRACLRKQCIPSLLNTHWSIHQTSIITLSASIQYGQTSSHLPIRIQGARDHQPGQVLVGSEKLVFHTIPDATPLSLLPSDGRRLVRSSHVASECTLYWLIFTFALYFCASRPRIRCRDAETRCTPMRPPFLKEGSSPSMTHAACVTV